MKESSASLRAPAGLRRGATGRTGPLGSAGKAAAIAIGAGVVLAFALLVIPRAARPKVFPVPLVDVAETQEMRRRLGDLADGAEREGLPFETRAVGDVVRRWGAVLSSGVGDLEYLRRLTRERVQAALAAGQLDALLRLRAAQSRLFVRTLRGYSFSGPPSPELAELSGDFVERAKRSGWVRGTECIASDDELSTLFDLRWLELTQLREHPRFRPTLAELRSYYRYLLLYPGRDASPSELAARRLSYAEALAKRDADYPIELARAVLLAELGHVPESARSLSDYLSRGDRRFWRHLARNYLLFAARDSPETGGDFALPDAP